jgi:hypothetical protein
MSKFSKNGRHQNLESSLLSIEEQPCDIVEQEYITLNSKFKSICVDTLMEYIKNVSAVVRDKVKQMLPTKLMFLSRKESQLTIEEATSVDCFLKPPVILIEEGQEPQRKRKRLDQEVKEDLQKEEEVKYIDLKWINATSNVVERFFSLLKRVYTPHRRGMNGDNLERILFLNVNRSFWKLNEIVKVYDKLPIK